MIGIVAVASSGWFIIMPKKDKRQRREAKRKAKQQASRRQASVSPAKRLAEAKGEIECWASDQFESSGQLQIFVYKRGAGLKGVACFLIDRGVVGLKDAWVRVGVDRNKFDGILETSQDEGIPMRPSTSDEVQRWVGAAVRWAHDNGMRLPRDWVKAAAFVGGVGDWKSADVSRFVKEFAGHPEDLRQRLIGEPFDTYIQRTDIQLVFSDEAPYMDQKTGRYAQELNPFDDDDEDSDDADDIDDEIESALDAIPEEQIDAFLARFVPAAIALTANTQQWLRARGVEPSPALPSAWQTVMMARTLSVGAMPDASEEEIADCGFDLMKDLGGRYESASEAAEHHRALGQVLEHLQTDTMMMRKAIEPYGLGEGDISPGEEQ